MNEKVDEYEINSIKLKNVLCVQDLRNNLISISSITDNGYTNVLKNNHAMVRCQDGKVVLTVLKCDHLYVLNKQNEHATFTRVEKDRELLK